LLPKKTSLAWVNVLVPLITEIIFSVGHCNGETGNPHKFSLAELHAPVQEKISTAKMMYPSM